MQGHINPAIQFSERLIHLGVHVTFFTTVGAHHQCMIKSPPPDGLSFSTFSDSYDDRVVPMDNADKRWDQIKRNGSKALTNLILAMVLDIYYYYYNGFADVIGNNSDDRPSYSIQLPGLSLLLVTHDLPSFLLASNPYALVYPKFQAQLEALEKESNPRVLVNTFDALKPKALKVLEKLNLVSVGPLVPYAILDGRDCSKNYIKWLNLNSELMKLDFTSLVCSLSVRWTT
ncbi:UDP-glycosyltransferase 75C1-like [Quercus lobata]|uniref:UDP-glycosyltransferase 75C1-like n=1 Tax=Quercus lobata TaxID=97700 RepID=UPI0012469C5A|nr:UDP-glycosyltransferase 75C1-like [Quercus lobata]